MSFTTLLIQKYEENEKILLPCLLSFNSFGTKYPSSWPTIPRRSPAPGQPFPGGQPSEEPADHISVHGIVKSASPQKISVESESGTVEFAVDDYSEVSPPINPIRSGRS